MNLQISLTKEEMSQYNRVHQKFFPGIRTVLFDEVLLGKVQEQLAYEKFTFSKQATKTVITKNF